MNNVLRRTEYRMMSFEEGKKAGGTENCWVLV